MEEKTRLRLEAMFNEADRLLNEKAIEEGLGMLRSIVTEEPTFGKAYNHIGWVYETKFKDYEKAVENYKKAMEYMPDYTSTYYNYAGVLSILKRWDELTAVVNKGLAVPNINAGTLHNEIGTMYEKQEKFKEAIDAYKKYAMATLYTKNVDTAKESIERCKKKLDIMKL